MRGRSPRATVAFLGRSASFCPSQRKELFDAAAKTETHSAVISLSHNAAELLVLVLPTQSISALYAVIQPTN